MIKAGDWKTFSNQNWLTTFPSAPYQLHCLKARRLVFQIEKSKKNTFKSKNRKRFKRSIRSDKLKSATFSFPVQKYFITNSNDSLAWYKRYPNRFLENYLLHDSFFQVIGNTLNQHSFMIKQHIQIFILFLIFYLSCLSFNLIKSCDFNQGIFNWLFLIFFLKRKQIFKKRGYNRSILQVATQ